MTIEQLLDALEDRQDRFLTDFARTKDVMFFHMAQAYFDALELAKKVAEE